MCLICALSVLDFSVILKQEVCRGRLVVTSEAALQLRIPKALVFLNTGLAEHDDEGHGCLHEVASRSGVTYLFH